MPKLGSFCNITKLAGFEHTKYIQNNATHNKVHDTDVPLFIGRTIQNGKINTNYEWFIPQHISEVLTRSKLVRKSLVLPYVGTVGDLAIFDFDYQCHLGSNVAKIELNVGCDYSEEYIYYFLKSPFGQKLLLKDIQGGIQKNITMQAIRNVEIPTITRREQLRITNILGSLDEKIEINQKKIAELEELAKLIYDYWFVQFDFPDENGKPYKSSGGKMVYNETLKMYIPEKWKNGLLGEMFEIEMGSSPVGSSINESKNGIPFFQGKIDFGQRFPSVRTYTTSPTKTAKELSVLLTVRAPVGDLNITLNKCCIGRGIASITSSARSYTFYTLNHLKPHFEYYNSFGTTFGSINKDDLFNIKTIISPISVIEKFEEFVLPIDNVIRKLSIENRELEQLRDWLLPMLMNGQVTVEE